MRLGEWKRNLGVLALLLLCAVLAAGVAGSALAQQKPVKEDSVVAPIEEPLLTFKNIEAAWLKGNAQAIASLASESPIFVEIRGIERKGGFLTQPQLLYIFKQMFEGTSQISFQFIKYRNLENPDRRVYGVARRQYKNLRRGGVFEDTIYFTLVKEGPRWAVAEIKSTW
jgi:hypothetical protein